MAQRGVNKAIIIGNVGSDPELKYTTSGTAVTNFSVATNESWTGADGEKKESTEWHRVVAFKKVAEICSQYLSKGKKVYVEGKLQTRTWESEGVKRYTTEIVIRDIQFLSPHDGDDSYQGGSGNGGNAGGQNSGPPSEPPPYSADDDLPF